MSPSSGQFDEGESVTIISTPDSGWIFSNWEGDWTSSQTPAIITMDRDKTIIGVFERKEYPLNITIGEGEGSVSERVVSQPKVTDYPFETVVELTPVPANEWWVFSSWSGDITSDQQIVEVTVNGETNVTLNFGFTGNFYKTTYSYDVSNRLIEQIRTRTAGLGNWETSREVWTYDINDNLTENVVYLDGIEYRKYTYQYDSNNNMSQEIFYREGIEAVRVNYNYDDNDNLIETIRTNPEDSPYTEYTYEYDSDGKLIKRTRYGSDYFMWSQTYKYDANGYEIEVITKDGGGNITNTKITEYNTKGNITSRVNYNSDGSINSSYTVEYDSNDNIISYILKSGTFDILVTNKYDSNNNKIETKSYDNQSNQLRYTTTYEYDLQNNQVRVNNFNSSNNLEYFIMFEYDSNNSLIEEVRYEYQKGNIVSYQSESDPFKELCNQLNLPEQQTIPMSCEE